MKLQLQFNCRTAEGGSVVRCGEQGGAAFRICLVPGSKVQFGINLREFAYAAEDRKAA